MGTGWCQHLEQVKDIVRVQSVITETVQDLHPRAQRQVLETGFSQRVGLPFLQLPAVVYDVLEVAVEGLGPGTTAPERKHVTIKHTGGLGEGGTAGQGLAEGRGSHKKQRRTGRHRSVCQPLVEPGVIAPPAGTSHGQVLNRVSTLGVSHSTGCLTLSHEQPMLVKQVHVSLIDGTDCEAAAHSPPVCTQRERLLGLDAVGLPSPVTFHFRLKCKGGENFSGHKHPLRCATIIFYSVIHKY